MRPSRWRSRAARRSDAARRCAQRPAGAAAPPRSSTSARSSPMPRTSCARRSRRCVCRSMRWHVPANRRNAEPALRTTRFRRGARDATRRAAARARATRAPRDAAHTSASSSTAWRARSSRSSLPLADRKRIDLGVEAAADVEVTGDRAGAARCCCATSSTTHSRYTPDGGSRRRAHRARCRRERRNTRGRRHRSGNPGRRTRARVRSFLSCARHGHAGAAASGWRSSRSLRTGTARASTSIPVRGGRGSWSSPVSGGPSRPLKAPLRFSSQSLRHRGPWPTTIGGDAMTGKTLIRNPCSWPHSVPPQWPRPVAAYFYSTAPHAEQTPGGRRGERDAGACGGDRARTVCRISRRW